MSVNSAGYAPKTGVAGEGFSQGRHGTCELGAVTWGSAWRNVGTGPAGGCLARPTSSAAMSGVTGTAGLSGSAWPGRPGAPELRANLGVRSQQTVAGAAGTQLDRRWVVLEKRDE